MSMVMYPNAQPHPAVDKGGHLTRPEEVVTLRGNITARNSRIFTRVIAVLAMIVAGTATVLAGASPASAAAGNLRPPVDLGKRLYICQGYAGPVSHSGTSYYGLDLTGSPRCGNGASGWNVRTLASGRIAYWQPAYGNLCVNTSGGRSYTLTHINATKTSGTVSAGQVVGRVAAPRTRGNGGVAHIHLQFWQRPGCYNSPGVPFDNAHTARICGAPNMTATGAGGTNGRWSGRSFVAQRCG